MVGNRGTRWHDEAEENLVRDGIAVSAALLAGWMALTIVGCAVSGAADGSRSAQAGDTYHSPTMDLLVRDVDEPTRIVKIAEDVQAREAERVAAEEAAAEQAAAEEAAYWEAYYAEQSYSTGYSGDGFMQEGVREYNGRTETWYSSNTLYHYRTDEWTVDSEGFYRTDEGYYVVAASDMEQGTVFEGSKGECIVLDSGCAEGVTDYYVAW